jgi:hypothetical protein
MAVATAADGLWAFLLGLGRLGHGRRWLLGVLAAESIMPCRILAIPVCRSLDPIIFLYGQYIFQ